MFTVKYSKRPFILALFSLDFLSSKISIMYIIGEMDMGFWGKKRPSFFR